MNQLHAPPQRAHSVFIQPCDVLTIKDDLPGTEGNKTQQQAREGGFTAAAFANHTKRRTSFQGDGDIGNGMHLRYGAKQAPPPFKYLRQTFGMQQGPCHGVAWWQATRLPGRISRARGFSLRQSAVASAQRG